jgi:hypothetical protein
VAIRTFGSVPFPPLRVVDQEQPIEVAWLLLKLKEWGGAASILIRSEQGAERRGGYFFHVSQESDGIQFADFEGETVVQLPLADAVRLINHASGRAFDEEMLLLCQRTVNLRQDA